MATEIFEIASTSDNRGEPVAEGNINSFEIASTSNNRGEPVAKGNINSSKEDSTHYMTSYLNERVEKKEEQILKLEAGVFQVANYYFVFQGVMLTATINGSSRGLSCKHYWLPMAISVIGAILNLGTLVIIAKKYKDGLDELDTRFRDLYKHNYRTGQSTSILKLHRSNKAWRQVIMATSLLLFVGFVVLNLVAAKLILC